VEFSCSSNDMLPDSSMEQTTMGSDLANREIRCQLTMDSHTHKLGGHQLPSRSLKWHSW
jgi:hypothetical protein